MRQLPQISIASILLCIFGTCRAQSTKLPDLPDPGALITIFSESSSLTTTYLIGERNVRVFAWGIGDTLLCDHHAKLKPSWIKTCTRISQDVLTLHTDTTKLNALPFIQVLVRNGSKSNKYYMDFANGDDQVFSDFLEELKNKLDKKGIITDFTQCINSLELDAGN